MSTPGRLVLGHEALLPPAGLAREWLLTNGLGSYAMGTVARIPTRRYHGNLVAALRPPRDRHLILGPVLLELTLGERRIPLWSGEWAPGLFSPDGSGPLLGFEEVLGCPRFSWSVGGAQLSEEIRMPHLRQGVLLRYEWRSPEPGLLELVPLVSGRSHHGDGLPGGMSAQPFADGVLLSLSGERWLLRMPGASFWPQEDRYEHLYYRAEAERGLPSAEDLFSPGRFRLLLPAGHRRFFLVAGHIGEEELFSVPERFWEEEEARRIALLRRAPRLPPALVLAADDFLVSDNRGRSTIIAGYPWFTDWGRDSMIALPGLTLPTGRPDKAQEILRTWGESIRRGLLPNRFPDEQEEPEMNSVDAVLWFILRLAGISFATGDSALLRDLFPQVEEALSALFTGTLYGIGVDDSDGLLSASWPGVALTWMDARVGEWVVTPRAGKPVEVQALWYNALRLRDDMAARLGRERRYDRLSRTVLHSIRKRFLRGDGHGLYDGIAPGGIADGAIRPNQVFALALPYPILPRSDQERVLRTVARHLFTPLGLYSLSPTDPAFRSRFTGPPPERDAAYHQGAVWSYLLGPYFDALYRFHPDLGQNTLQQVLPFLSSHLGEAGLGSVSEVFDPTSLEGKGCPFQAWGVAEVLRLFDRSQGSWRARDFFGRSRPEPLSSRDRTPWDGPGPS